MAGVLDIFKGDMFSVTSLTNAINKMPFKPSRIGAMKVFASHPVPTTIITLEEKDGVLALIPTRARGPVPAPVGTPAKRTGRMFKIPHVPIEDAVYAKDVQNIRVFGSPSETQGVVQVVNDKIAILRQSHEVTLEYHRMGALHGVVYDADGKTPLVNLWDEFGVTEITVDFNFGVETTSIRGQCLEVARKIERNLGALTYDHIHCLCGKTFFQALIDHATVIKAYDRYQESKFLRDDPRKGFEFAGVIFEEYRQGIVGDIKFMADDSARFFPMGVAGLFETYFAPADFIEAVNTLGLEYYAKQQVMDFDKGVMIHTQSNPLCLCLRPRVLIKGTQS